MQLIAVRQYDLNEVKCVDTLHRRGSSFALHLTGADEPPSWCIMSEEIARQWLSETPEQLVIVVDFG